MTAATASAGAVLATRYVRLERARACSSVGSPCVETTGAVGSAAHARPARTAWLVIVFAPLPAVESSAATTDVVAVAGLARKRRHAPRKGCARVSRTATERSAVLMAAAGFVVSARRRKRALEENVIAWAAATGRNAGRTDVGISAAHFARPRPTAQRERASHGLAPALNSFSASPIATPAINRAWEHAIREPNRPLLRNSARWQAVGGLSVEGLGHGTRWPAR